MSRKRPHPVPIEINNNSTQDLIADKNRFHDYFNIYTLKNQPTNIKYIESIAKELVDWAQTEDALTLEQFWLVKGIDGSTVKKWKGLSPVFKAAHSFAKGTIAVRREIGGLKNKLNTPMILSSMPMYSNRWKNLTKWRASLKNKNEEEKPIRVLIEQIPSSDIVPTKKEDDAE